MNVTVFEAINITKKYRNTLALNQVSMSVMQGDIYGFIGENGAGKTTMIRLLTGLAEPTTGKIALFGESNKKLAKQRERIGCIIESPSLYLDMTAYENLEVQRLQRGIPGKGCIDNALALSLRSSQRRSCMLVATFMGARSFPVVLFLPFNWIISHFPQSWKFLIFPLIPTLWIYGTGHKNVL